VVGRNGIDLGVVVEAFLGEQRLAVPAYLLLRTVLVADFLLAHDYELSRKDGASIGRAVSQFLSDSALFMPGRSA
jgi:hypothetical protein